MEFSIMPSLRAKIRFNHGVCAWLVVVAASLEASCSSDQTATGIGGAGAMPVSSSGAAGAGLEGASATTGGTSNLAGAGSGGIGGAGTGISGGSSAGPGTSGTAGSSGAAAGGASGGSGGIAGSAAGAAGKSGAGGSSTGGAGNAGAAGTGGGSAGPFVCNQLTGGKLTEEWFIAGFEKVVDSSRWQVKWREDAYVEVWADAQSSFWTAQVDSTCANGSSAPDRLVFGAVSFKYKTQAEWRTGITQAVNNFKAKWPSVRRVDLVSQIRGPNNMLCPTAPIAGETIAVPPEQDAAMAEVAAAFPGFVFVGPKVQAHSCSEFVGGGPHLTTAGNTANVQPFADYFVQVQ